MAKGSTLEKALRKHDLEIKQDRDNDTLRAFGEKLRSTVKNYRQELTAYTTGGRKNRALALGECILQAAERLEAEGVHHNFVPGSLAWRIVEDRVKDEDGKKGYKYTVETVIATDEPAYTEDQIREQLEDLQKRLETETAEMFADVYEPPAEDVAGEVKDTMIQ